MLFAPSKNPTVPVAVPALAFTVAVKVTGWSNTVAPADCTTVLVVATGRLIVNETDLFGSWFPARSTL